MVNDLSCITNIATLKPIGSNANTGIDIYQSFQAASGLNYQVGIRSTHGLLIIEGIAEGTACTFLCSIQVRDEKTGNEICSIAIPKNTRYCRQLVVRLVKQRLCDTLTETAIKEGTATDKADVERQVGEMLDDCYFRESRQTALSWAERIGLIKHKE